MKYFLITLGVVLLIIFGIVILSSGGSEQVSTSGHKVVKLSDYTNNNDASVQYYIEGPINAIEEHVALRITISPLTRELNVYQGYQGEVIAAKTYPNTTNAYGEFLAALNRAGFTTERKLAAGVAADSVCPTGTRSHFSLVASSKNLVDLWSASCVTGSFGGSTSLATNLFTTQIPDYDTIVSSANTSTRSTGSIH